MAHRRVDRGLTERQRRLHVTGTGAHTITGTSDWSTNGRNEDICALVSGPGERLLMRSFRSVQVWSAAVASDGTLNVQRAFDFP